MFDGLKLDSVSVTEFVATPPGEGLPGFVGCWVGVVVGPVLLSELPPHAVSATAIAAIATHRQ